MASVADVCVGSVGGQGLCQGLHGEAPANAEKIDHVSVVQTALCVLVPTAGRMKYV